MIKVFRSPRDLFLFLEKADGCVRIISGPSVDSVVSGSGANSCLRYGLGEPVGLRVYGLGSPRACRCCGTE